ncbi:MAG TPA: hypothetical protein VKA98_02770 [Nitrososphaeraceae archaeon]|nr:hypothetical protein [Nitrososphaeraceae archaeon]
MNMLELEEEEKRKRFMEHQMSYLENVIENGEPPGSPDDIHMHFVCVFDY